MGWEVRFFSELNDQYKNVDSYLSLLEGFESYDGFKDKWVKICRSSFYPRKNRLMEESCTTMNAKSIVNKFNASHFRDKKSNDLVYCTAFEIDRYISKVTGRSPYEKVKLRGELFLKGPNASWCSYAKGLDLVWDIGSYKDYGPFLDDTVPWKRNVSNALSELEYILEFPYITKLIGAGHGCDLEPQDAFLLFILDEDSRHSDDVVESAIESDTELIFVRRGYIAYNKKLVAGNLKSFVEEIAKRGLAEELLGYHSASLAK